MGFSININWMDEFSQHPDRWDNLGRNLLRENCQHFDKDKDCNNIDYSGYCEKCEVYEDSCEPMMNYYYPLEIEPTEENILKVVENTNLTVMYNNDTDEYVLVLCGGGMDLSQDIALAYFYCQRWIPDELLLNVCTQKDLSVSGEKWELLRDEMIYQLKTTIGNYESKLKEWEDLKKK